MGTQAQARRDARQDRDKRRNRASTAVPRQELAREVGQRSCALGWPPLQSEVWSSRSERLPIRFIAPFCPSVIDAASCIGTSTKELILVVVLRKQQLARRMLKVSRMRRHDMDHGTGAQLGL